MGGQAGGRTTGVKARKSRRRSIAGDEDHRWDPCVSWRGVRCLVNNVSHKALGGNHGGLERRSGVAGGGNSKLQPKHAKLLANVGVAEMVHCWSIRAPKRCTRCISRGSRLVGGSKGSGGNTVGDINGKLQETQDAQEEDIATVLADCGMVDMTVHFTPRRRYRGGV